MNIFAIQAVLGGIAVLLWLIAPEGFSEPFNLLILAVLFSSLAVHYRFTAKHSKLHIIVHPDVVFLVGYTVINFGLAMMLALHVIEFQSIEWRYPAGGSFTKSTAVSLVGAIGFSLGFMWYGSRYGSKARLERGGMTTPYLAKASIGLLVFPGVILFLYFLLTSATGYFAGRYDGLAGIEEDAVISLWVSRVLLTLAFSLAVASAERLKDAFRFDFLMAAVPYGGMLLAFTLHGDRGSMIQCASPLLWLVSQNLPKRGSLILVGVLCVLGLIGIGLIKESRARSSRNITSLLEVAADQNYSELAMDGLVNTGSSGLLNAVAVERCTTRDFFWGRFSANSALGIIPFSRRILRSVGVLSEGPTSSSNYLTYIVNGPNAISGTGTSSVADMYFDFGVVGVALGHFFVGAIAALILSIGETTNRLELRGLFIACVGTFAIMPRYSAISFLFRTIGYSAVATYVVMRVAASISSKRFVRSRRRSV